MRDVFVALIVAFGVAASLLGGPFYALLFYLWNSYFRPEQWLWNDWISQLRLPYAVGLLLLVLVVVTGKSLRVDRRFLIPGAFVLTCVVSYWQSAYQVATWPFLEEFLKVVVISYLITVLVDDASKLRLVLMTMVAGLGLEGAKQGWVGLVRSPGAANNNPVPFLGDNNGVALGMLMLVALLVALIQTSKHSWEKGAFQFLTVGVCLRALVTYSRGGFLAATAMALYYLAYSQRRLRTVVVMVVLLLIVVPTLPARYWDRMGTITASDDERDESARGRLQAWSAGIAMAGDSPILGVGFQAFKSAYDRYDSSGGAYGTQRAAHSSWVGALAEVGAIGLILYVLLLGQAIVLSRRAIRLASSDSDTDRICRACGRGLQAAMVVAIVGGTFLHIQYTEMLWHLFALSIVVHTIARQSAQARTESSRLGSSVEPVRLARVS